MEFLMEFLIDLILEGSICLSTNKKVPVFIRYFLIFFIVLFFITIIGGLFVLGIVISYQNKVAGLFVIIISLIFYSMSQVIILRYLINTELQSFFSKYL